MRKLFLVLVALFAVNVYGADKADLIEQMEDIQADYVACISQRSCKNVILENRMNALLADANYVQAFSACERDSHCDAIAREVGMKMITALSYFK